MIDFNRFELINIYHITSLLFSSLTSCNKICMTIQPNTWLLARNVMKPSMTILCLYPWQTVFMEGRGGGGGGRVYGYTVFMLSHLSICLCQSTRIECYVTHCP